MVKVHKWDSAKDGQLTEEALKRKLESFGYHVSRYVYGPGTVFPEHKHDEEKIDGVYSGRLEMGMDGQTVVLQAGDTLEVPKGVTHTAKVLGSEPVISFDASKY